MLKVEGEKHITTYLSLKLVTVETTLATLPLLNFTHIL